MDAPTIAPLPAPNDTGLKERLSELNPVVVYHIILEKFWLIVASVAAFFFFGLIYITISTRIYEAKATIEVEQTDTPIVSANPNSPAPTNYRDLEVLRTIETELGRRSLLVRVLKRSEFQGNRYLGALTLDPENPSLANQLASLQKCIHPQLQRSTRLIDIVVDFRDPDTAQQLANALAAEYLIEMVTTRSGNSADVTKFLEEEADKMKAKLAQTEMSLQDYKSLVDLRTRIIENEKEIATLNKRYLWKHPKLIAAQNLMTDLRAQFVTEMRKRAKTSMQVEQMDSAEKNLSEADRLEREMARQESRYNVLLRDLQTDRAIYEAIQERRKEAGVAQSSKLVSIHVVETASVPVHPVRPRKLMALAASIAMGGIFGLVLAFWLNSLDSSLKTVDDAERYLGLSLLGAIPENRDPEREKLVFESPFGADGKIENTLRKSIPISREYYGRVRQWTERTITRWKQRKSEKNGTPQVNLAPVADPGKQPKKHPHTEKIPEEKRHIVMTEEPNSIVSESFRNMRAALKLLGMQDERRTFLFSSAVPAEGKSFVAANFATSLAQEGNRVLLIDADLRRPTVHKTFNIPFARNGLTEYLSGQAPLVKLAAPTFIPNLSVLTAGSISPNPAELLSSGGFPKLLREAMEHFDRVVIDSAPIHAVSDTLLVCNTAQTVCLVVRAGATPREAVARAARMLKGYGARLSGFVMNRVPMQTGFGYNPYYYYYQSSERYGQAYGETYGSSRKS